MAESNYPNRGFQRAGDDFRIRFDSDRDLSMSEYADTFSDVEAIYRASAREVVSRLRGSNAQKPRAVLAIREFSTGSLDLLVDPYFSGIVAGIAANAIFAVFLHALRRINGRPQDNQAGSNASPNNNVISDERFRAAATRVVELTTNQRRRLRDKRHVYGLSIKVTFGQTTVDVTEEH